VTSSPTSPARALAAVAVRARKSRGQNFLVQPAIATRIVAALEIHPGDTVIEIGPGLGILSDLLAREDLRRLCLVEVDPQLAARLAEHFSGDARIDVVNRDFLEADLLALAAETPLRIIGNLPFNIAAAILERLHELHDLVTRMVLMFQREVAERIRARSGTRAYGALSVFTALYWEVQGHFRVAAGSFHPRPEVDAEVLVLTPQRAPAFAAYEERAVLATVRAAFSAPRKTIRNSLADGLSLDGPAAEAALRRAAIDPAVRPGAVTATDFVRLARVLAAVARGETVRNA
jgi:16S rRNA (adenine1518-N6/adenine1519-N6)-dimethyltransferase